MMAYVTFRPVSREELRPALLPMLQSFVEVASVVCAFGFVLAVVIGAV
jgi:hypothetical protein